MFFRATSKLEDARTNLDDMISTTSAIQFKAAFVSFLSNCRAITFAMQKEGAHVDRFSRWYKRKQRAMKEDELLRFIHVARTEDFHEGYHRLRFETSFRSLLPDDAGPPPQPGAAIVVLPEGPFWIINEGTPRQRRIPVKQGSKHITSVSIDNPPKVHLGKPLCACDPVTICRCAEAYMSELVYDAKQRFQPPSKKR